MLEFDAWDLSPYPGEYRESDYYIWGYDDLSWFYMHSKEERKEILHYLWNFMKENYKGDGFLELPCRRLANLIPGTYPVTVWEKPDLEWLDEKLYSQSISYTLDEKGRALLQTRNYNAHNPCDACPWGMGDEDVIKEIFEKG